MNEALITQAIENIEKRFIDIFKFKRIFSQIWRGWSNKQAIEEVNKALITK